MNAIITAATGYQEQDLQLFLRSVGETCSNTKVFLIVLRKHFKAIQKLRFKYPFIEPIYVRRKLDRGSIIHRFIAGYLTKKDYTSVSATSEFIGRYPLHIMFDRYFIALNVIRRYSGCFQNILLSDSRDVVIQHDPFAGLDGDLVCGLEEKTLGSCSYNSSWIKELYGDETFNAMQNWQIVCAGITIGTAKKIEDYLAIMCATIWKSLPIIIFKNNLDQGVHNYVIFDKKIACKLVDNRVGLIATLHHETSANIRKDEVSGLLEVHGKYPAIVHQYDRHPDLVQFYRQRLTPPGG